MSGKEDAYYWRIVHDRQVDDLLVELIDLLISIRYAHPAMVQLEMISGTRRTVKGALPPSYVNTPVSIAYAEADDALIVTMTRILGLCWAYDYERTPALTPEQLAEFTGRPRSTFYRHLKLLREMQWIRVDQAGRRIVIRPIITRCAQAVDRQAARTGEPAEEPAGAAGPQRRASASPGGYWGRESQTQSTRRPGHRPALGAGLAALGETSPSPELDQPRGEHHPETRERRAASR